MKDQDIETENRIHDIKVRTSLLRAFDCLLVSNRSKEEISKEIWAWAKRWNIKL